MKWSTLLSKVVFAAGQQQEQQPPPPPPPPPGSPFHRQQAVQDLATPRLSSASTGGDESNPVSGDAWPAPMRSRYSLFRV
jgi:hypothetical protein